MPLTTQNSPLVSGAEFDFKRGRLDAKAGQLRVVRAICINGQRIEVGEIASGISAATASELISAGKLVREPVPANPPHASPHVETNHPKPAIAGKKE